MSFHGLERAFPSPPRDTVAIFESSDSLTGHFNYRAIARQKVRNGYEKCAPWKRETEDTASAASVDLDLTKISSHSCPTSPWCYLFFATSCVYLSSLSRRQSERNHPHPHFAKIVALVGQRSRATNARAFAATGRPQCGLPQMASLESARLVLIRYIVVC